MGSAKTAIDALSTISFAAAAKYKRATPVIPYDSIPPTFRLDHRYQVGGHRYSLLFQGTWRRNIG